MPVSSSQGIVTSANASPGSRRPPWRARAHDHRRLDPRIGESTAHERQGLARDRLRCLGSERVPRHADGIEVEPPAEWMAFRIRPLAERVEHGRHVQHSAAKVLQRCRRLHRCRPATRRQLEPHRFVASEVLQEYRGIATPGPVLPEVAAALPRAAQAMAEENDRASSSSIGRQIHPHRYRPVSGGVGDVEVDLRGLRAGGNLQRVVTG